MKQGLIFGLSILIFFYCTAIQKATPGRNKLEIVSVDSTDDFYVFSVIRSIDTIIVVGEKRNVSICRPFKKFIKEDSIHESAKLKSGLKYVWIGFNELTINNIKVKKKGELTKIVTNCMAFDD